MFSYPVGLEEPGYNLVYLGDVDLEQLVHPRSLIRAFAFNMKNLETKAAHRVPSKDSDQIARMRKLI